MLEEKAVFAQVVDCGGFSAAARKLGMGVPAVSRHVSRLEAHLGERLLLRSTRNQVLTEIGQQVYRACQQLVSQAREVHAVADRFSARPAGVLRVCAPIVFGQSWLAPRLPAFLDANPEVRLQLTLVDRMVDLIDEGVDVTLRIAPELAPGLAARVLCPMHYVLVASAAYLQHHPAPLQPAALAGHRCTYLGYGRFGPQLLLHQGSEQAQVTLVDGVQINNSAAILALVEAGGGIGLVPDFTAHDALRAGRVQRVLPGWRIGEPYTGTVHVAYTPGRHLALKVRAFIDYLVAAVAADTDTGAEGDEAPPAV
ncbi:MAG: HTH-type transcriptional regulator DmlR [Stenotrophomonas maltophilia]|nr:MAG: HTH-type transcriptional regulator DmlR [Stenotrophomonas maltophilia]